MILFALGAQAARRAVAKACNSLVRVVECVIGMLQFQTAAVTFEKGLERDLWGGTDRRPVEKNLS
jgi:hypothetical protein